MTTKSSVFSVLLLSLLSACAPAPQPVAAPTPGAPTPTPVASDIVTPVASAEPAPAASPSAAPVVSAPALDFIKGKALKSYDYEGIGGIYYDFSQNLLYVADGADNDETPRRYLLRKFQLDGTFVDAFPIAPTGEKAPDYLGGVAFDRRGIPYYTYREDEEFRLLKLITATVQPANRLPIFEWERSGLSTLSADDDIFNLAFVRYDPDSITSTDRKILYARAEEDESPEALFPFDDPFEPTTMMAFAPGGVLYMAGPKRGGGFGIKRINKNQVMEDAPITLTALPQRMVISPTSDMYLIYEATSRPATIARFALTGESKGQSEIKLENGAYLTNISGMTFDGTGQPLLSGTGLDTAAKPFEGIFKF